tara:strand:+ start:1716 stop:2135 length:420 start_codon:yes stop_codon:yes gene_type:complete
MSRIIKTISLDKESDEIASKKKNFSAWVRKQLKEESSLVEYNHITRSIFEQKGICNPSSTPRCGICYPYGKPTTKDIRNYNLGLISPDELKLLTKNHYDGVIPIPKTTINDYEPLDPPMRKQKERKYLRRALKYIWSFI